ncbi:hypothetical protein BH11BAC3_BH11BAC3_13150 [soil metagenome]
MKTAYSNDAGEFPFQIDEFYLDLQENGNNISMLSADEIEKSPFPGLRPFKTSEFQLFNGRVGQSEELIKRLKKNRFLAVIGSSGTGKSSLVRAGLLPQLFGGYLHGAGSKWNIAICRPGKDPVENLAIALASIQTHNKEAKDLYENFTKFEPLLSNSIYGLIDSKEVLDAEHTEKEPTNLLIIIDQFEELFRFNRKDLDKENIENQFVNLLLKASLDPRNSIYIIITMRSEFLGDCVKYRGLAEAINEGQYLVPQLTRNELKEVIENPISLAGKKISPQLVELLINEIEESKLKENQDQLPILQHALMRTYNEAMLEGPHTVITYEHYKRTGEMEKALANHAEAKFNMLGAANQSANVYSKKQSIAKVIFKSLTDLGVDQKGGRRPTELKNIYAIAAALNVTEKEVDEVVNHFRGSDTSFIMPPINTDLYSNLIIDISHESLMRNWSRLNEWITEEVKMGTLYKLLNDRRELHEQDKEEWLRGMLLRELLEWKQHYPTNVTWASRYHKLPNKINDPALHEKIYNENLAYLAESDRVNEQLRVAEKEELRQNLQREQRAQSNKKRAWLFAIASTISLLFGIWAFSESSNAKASAKLAEAQTILAQQNALSAKENADAASRSAIAAVKQGRIAEEQRAKADSNSALLEKQTKLLAKLASEANRQKDTALVLKGNAEKKKEDFQKQLVKNVLKSQNFYFSNALDQATKEEIIDALYTTPKFDSGQIKLNEYVDPDLLAKINRAVEIKENIANDPINNLNEVKEIWKKKPNPILKKILLSIVNDNIFRTSEINVADAINLSNTNFALPNNNGGFAYNINSQVITGKDLNDTLVINENSFDVPFNRFFCATNVPASSNAKIEALNFNDSNNVVTLVNNFMVQLNTDGELTGSKKMEGLPKNYVTTQLSPDGKAAFFVDTDGNALLWNTSSTNGHSKIDTIGNFKNKPIGKEDIVFSRNSKFLFLNVDGKARVIDKQSKVLVTSDRENEKFLAGVFASDSKSIITVAEGKIGVRDTLLNIENKYQSINLALPPFKQSSLKADKVNDIAVSNDWSRLILSQDDQKVFLVENKMGKSVFSNDAEAVLRIKEIGNSKNRMKAGFYNDSTIIAVNNGGAISLWNIYRDFDDPDSAIATVLPQSSFKEKLEQKLMFSKDVLKSATAPELNIAAEYYFRQEFIDTAKLIYLQLLKKSTGEVKAHYLDRILAMNAELNTVDRINDKLDPKRVKTDTIKAYRSMKVDRLKENIGFIEQQVKLCPDNKEYARSLSTTYGSLSFNQIFMDDYYGTITSANRGLAQLDSFPENDWIYTNLALGYLLTGRYRLAEQIYKDNKDKMFYDKSNSFRTAFLADFNDLESAGAFNNLDPMIIKDIARIKDILNDVPDSRPVNKSGKG